jgi:hypothetical protein
MNIDEARLPARIRQQAHVLAQMVSFKYSFTYLKFIIL